MSILQTTSSPLSTLFPDSSPLQLPNYNNVFNFNFGTTINTPKLQSQFNIEEQIKKSNTGSFFTPSGAKNNDGDDGDDGDDGKSALKNWLGNKKTQASLSTISDFTNLVGSFMPEKSEYSGKYGSITKTTDQGYYKVADWLAKKGGVAGAIGNGAKILGDVGKVTNAIGAGTDGMTTFDAVMGSPILNITPVGLVNGIFGKRANSFTKNNEAFSKVGSSYTGSENKANEAIELANKKYGLFSSGARNEANEKIATAQNEQQLIENIGDYQEDRSNLQASMSNINSNAYALKLQGGIRQNLTHLGRHGLSIYNITCITPIKEQNDLPQHKDGGSLIKLVKETSIQLINPITIPEFQNGGSVNVIPTGFLHARKHGMDLEGITKKGIPVISEKEDGGVIQQAEIELNEIILRLEVTKKIEKLKDKYYSDNSSKSDKDEAAYKAGELLIYEILHNTKDKTGLIKELK